MQPPILTFSEVTQTQLNVKQARVIARTERRGWEGQYEMLQRLLDRLNAEGPHPVYDEMVNELQARRKSAP